MKRPQWECPECGYPVFKARCPELCPQCMMLGRGVVRLVRYKESRPIRDCVERMRRPQQTATEDKSVAGPNVIGDRLAKHFDWSLGEWVDSKSARRKRYHASGMVVRSMAERRRRFGHRGPEKLNLTTSIPGVKPGRRPSQRMQIE